MNLFLEPRLSKDFAHYVVRKSILYILQVNHSEFRGTVVDLGCGNMPYKELILSQQEVKNYVGIDLKEREFYHVTPDLFWDGKNIPLPDNSIDTLLLTEVIEHVAEPVALCKEINRVLKIGGKLIGTTPFFWPIHEAPNDMQRLTPFGLQRILAATGFQQVKITATGGWRLALAQFLCIFIGFGVTAKFLKSFLSVICYFPILWLSKKITLTESFHNKSMMTVVSFKAMK